MSERVKPSTADWLKVGGLLLAIAIAAIDMVVVRGRNKTLWNNLVAQQIEFEKNMKALEIKTGEEIARSNQQVKDAERKAAEARSKAKDAEAEFREEAREMQMTNQKKMEEQRKEYEKRIQEMKDDFTKRLNDMRTAARPTPQHSSSRENKQIRCRSCSGIGQIQVKERCGTCGGSGRVQRNSYGSRRGLTGTSTSTSTVQVDCPDCLPGKFKGGGSKGYRIERKTCPKCNGRGMVSEY